MSIIVPAGVLVLAGAGLYTVTKAAMESPSASASWSVMSETERAPAYDFMGKISRADDNSHQPGFFPRAVEPPYVTVSQPRPPHAYGVMGSGTIDLSDPEPYTWNTWLSNDFPTNIRPAAFTDNNVEEFQHLSKQTIEENRANAWRW